MILIKRIVVCLTLICGFFSSNAYAAEFELHKMTHFNPVTVIPFALLLLSIALLPFISKHTWEHNYHYISYGLGLIIAAYYIFYVRAGNGFGDITGTSSYGTHKLIHTAIEYYSFIALIGSLFVISGGIFIKMEKEATPLLNTIILLVGAVIANIFGTTGASMLLIRPFLRVNKFRAKGYHVVFFIFLVSNIGGALTPIGDPPLFLGYLKGVPFFWVIGKVWYIWVIATGIVLTVFYIIDSLHYSKSRGSIPKRATSGKMQIFGLQNFIYIFIILAVVLAQKMEFMGRIAEGMGENGEAIITVIIATIMAIVAFIAYKTSNREALTSNEFNFVPIKEVAILFAGIFATMIPTLDYLEQNAAELGVNTYGQFYWGAGMLSSVLDNAPTYLNFLSAAFGLGGLSVDADMAKFIDPNYTMTLVNGVTVYTWKYLQAISVAAVFFGAVTYIGNGPNFMVKSIADVSGVESPSFFGYVVKYSLPVLIPTYALIWFLFFR